MILRILWLPIIFPFGPNHRHRSPSCPCRAAIKFLRQKPICWDVPPWFEFVHSWRGMYQTDSCTDDLISLLTATRWTQKHLETTSQIWEKKAFHFFFFTNNVHLAEISRSIKIQHFMSILIQFTWVNVKYNVCHIGLHLVCYLPKEYHVTVLSVKDITTANMWLLWSWTFSSSEKKGGCHN